jgi:regulator of sigma D
MKKQERIESAQKRIQELKKLIDYWLKEKNELRLFHN